MYMTTTLSVTEARAQLPTLLDRVAEGAEITITRNGLPVATLIRPDRLKHRRAVVQAMLDAVDEDLRAMETLRGQPLPPPVHDPELAERRVAELRAERDEE